MKKKSIEVFINNKSSNHNKTGILKSVSRGYALNYLIPYNLGEIPSRKKKIYLQKIQTKNLHKQTEILLKQQELKKILERIKKFSLKKKSSGAYTFFGSVTEKDILETIYKTTGIKLSKNTILEKIIKHIGIHNISIELGSNIRADIKLYILPDPR
jgi:large subunit ribosomal protein L9|uniref:50S ribosomal protein L9, chloroplastic n=1 Tax=Thorea hispida TaxID=202687 RepID=A0A1C9CAM9_9FLOR|nr:ribosomal protein L9 [Thorea hispida]AOM65443.1 ribosomal protein L9 [Thorea hispida]ARX95812.1 50S ribosomal protein L9 [Thorea hispida]UNJ79102.1 ribosomal protein L9 [Thorea hispida]